jgi:hypothetical protein
MIEFCNVNPKLNFNDDKLTIYYLAKVRNQRTWQSIECAILLIGMSKKDPADGEFKKLPWNYNLPFGWSPSWFWKTGKDGYLTFTDDRTIDFGFLEKNSDKFSPSLLGYPRNFQGDVKKGDVIRFMLRPSTNSLSGKTQTFEVFWDGEWTENLELMNTHLVIKEIK